ncbi:MAG: NADH-quinone oxidoreductase subunit C, partial [Nitrospirales bacterium]|nr:NADH-quinone oxidoreductase subunit C [Nitrospirales bacterium]
MNAPSERAQADIVQELQQRFGEGAFVQQETRDPFPTLWVRKEQAGEVLRYLKLETEMPYRMLYDLTAIDERVRSQRPGQPAGDFTVVYHLLSFARNEDIRIKVPLQGEYPSLPSLTPLWAAADWYEREVWDMFGIAAEGHPNLRRILMPQTWTGHPLRKEHPARRTEIGPLFYPEKKDEREEKALQFRPEEWGMARRRDGTDFMFLNLGPHHTGTHGVLRIVLELDGEEIVDAVLDIGFHHRGAEKMGER